MRDTSRTRSGSGYSRKPCAGRATLLAWYDVSARVLPWRARAARSPIPIAVWLSEIMLQQTRVETVLSLLCEVSLERWPDVTALAAAPDEEIMRAWAGLGYYARARNLLACARRRSWREADFRQTKLKACANCPASALIRRPRSPRSPSANARTPVDGNIERVVARLFAVEETPLPRRKALIRASRRRADARASRRRFCASLDGSRRHDLHAEKPACAICPLDNICIARKGGAPETYPRRAPKAQRPERRGAVFVAIRADGAVLVRTRPPKGLLGGMTEFPGTEWSSDFDAANALNAAPLALDWRRKSGEVVHVFTHFALKLHVHVANAPQSRAAPAGARWSPGASLADEALPSLMRKVAAHAGLDLPTRRAR